MPGFAASPYNWSFAGLPLGSTASEPILTPTVRGQPITADQLGGMDVDYIRQGVSATLEIVLQEANSTGVQLVLSRFGVDGKISGIGCPMGEQFADVLCAEVVPYASCVDPNSAAWISYRAALAPNSPIPRGLGSNLQQVPLRFQLYPYLRNDEYHVFEFLASKPIGSDASRYGALNIDNTESTSFLGALSFSALALANGTGVEGTFYKVAGSASLAHGSALGSYDFGAGATALKQGDTLRYTGGEWVVA